MQWPPDPILSTARPRIRTTTRASADLWLHESGRDHQAKIHHNDAHNRGLDFLHPHILNIRKIQTQNRKLHTGDEATHEHGHVKHAERHLHDPDQVQEATFTTSYLFVTKKNNDYFLGEFVALALRSHLPLSSLGLNASIRKWILEECRVKINFQVTPDKISWPQPRHS